MEYRYPVVLKYFLFFLIVYLFLRYYKQITPDKYVWVALVITAIMFVLDFIMIKNHPPMQSESEYEKFSCYAGLADDNYNRLSDLNIGKNCIGANKNLENPDVTYINKRYGAIGKNSSTLNKRRNARKFKTSRCSEQPIKPHRNDEYNEELYEYDDNLPDDDFRYEYDDAIENAGEMNPEDNVNYVESNDSIRDPNLSHSRREMLDKTFEDGEYDNFDQYNYRTHKNL